MLQKQLDLIMIVELRF